MGIFFQWEESLLQQALKPLDLQGEQEASVDLSPSLLGQAYWHCEEITRDNSRTFFLASGLLPEEKRKAIRSIYAFCRITDDIVDRSGAQAGGELESWNKQVQQGITAEALEYPASASLVALAWRAAQRRYSIPVGYANQLIAGVSLDLLQNRYATFDQLVQYCYGVACTVGLMSMHVIGFNGVEAIPYAIRLGVALQLTNILRDIGEDWQMGRLYLPEDELEAFGLIEEDIGRGEVTRRWREFMRFQINRVRLLYASALPGIARLHPDGRFAIGAAAELYQAILVEIERNQYDVFTRRAVVGAFTKLCSLPGIWWRARTARYPAVPAQAIQSNSLQSYFEVRS